MMQEPASDVEGGGGGYIMTEDEDLEAEAAKNSPVKNGIRLTSQVSRILLVSDTKSPL